MLTHSTTTAAFLIALYCNYTALCGWIDVIQQPTNLQQMICCHAKGCCGVKYVPTDLMGAGSCGPLCEGRTWGREKESSKCSIFLFSSYYTVTTHPTSNHNKKRSSSMRTSTYAYPYLHWWALTSNITYNTTMHTQHLNILAPQLLRNMPFMHET